MRRYSVALLVAIGFIVIAAGTLDLLVEAGVVVGGLHLFGGLLVVAVGLWITACAVECRRLDSKP